MMVMYAGTDHSVGNILAVTAQKFEVIPGQRALVRLGLGHQGRQQAREHAPPHFLHLTSAEHFVLKYTCTVL